ncbi:MAG: hypothetical protein J6333_09445, partial [Planctomycetes bacterium]|nr:hypothetical protein [Planctomycetota bacterium]
MFRRRTIVIALVFTAAYLLMAARLYQLQVLERDHYVELGRQRTHRLKQVAPARGRILDSRGRVLAEDRARFDLWVKPASWRREGGKGPRRLLSYFDELTVEKINEVKKSPPGKQALEAHLAAITLYKTSPLVVRLAELLREPGETPPQARARVARAVA